MPDYRIYVLDKDEHINSPVELIFCPDDAAAIDRAKQLLDGHSIEVWDHARFVRRLDPPGSESG
jgi:hypothetical protein